MLITASQGPMVGGVSGMNMVRVANHVAEVCSTERGRVLTLCK